MRRFFISNLERLLNILTVLAGATLLAWSAMAAREALSDSRQLLLIAAILLGGLVVIIALAGCAHLALSFHDQTRRIAALIERSGSATLRATRKVAPPRPTPTHSADTPAGSPAATPPQHVPDSPAPANPAYGDESRPVHGTAAKDTRPTHPAVFSGLAMPKPPSAAESPLAAPQPMTAPLSRPADTPRSPRLVADRRLPR